MPLQIWTHNEPVLSFLSNLPGPTGQPVLEFLMTEWVAKQNSFIGPYDRKIRLKILIKVSPNSYKIHFICIIYSILALAKLLEHAVSHEDKRFQKIYVKGDRIINPVEGNKTRSKSKNGNNQII